MLTTYRSMTMHRSFADHMGFNWPKDMAMIRHGKKVTYAQLKEEKAEEQRSHLQAILMNDNPVIRPCFICAFKNKGFPFDGWWLCVYTLKNSWTLDFRVYREELILKIMKEYPLGYLPIDEKLDQWEAAFAKTYHYPTPKRPRHQGMVIARARVSSVGDLLDILF